MNDNDNRTAEPAHEAVFVLRLRAGVGGWWGQVRSIDEQMPRYVQDSAQLFALLESYWSVQRAAEGAAAQPQ